MSDLTDRTVLVAGLGVSGAALEQDPGAEAQEHPGRGGPGHPEPGDQDRASPQLAHSPTKSSQSA